MKRLLVGIALICQVPFCFASIISMQSLQVRPTQETLLGGELAPLFTILDLGVLTAPLTGPSLLPNFVFPGNETVLGFATTSVRNSVFSSESASSDGTRVLTSQSIKTTISRNLLSAEIIDVVGVDGFSIDNIEVRENALLFDFSPFNLNSLSELLISVTFSIETFEEILSETTETLASSVNTRTVTEVDSPSSLAILLSLATLLLISVFHKNNMRSNWQ
ncbi:hypothetical protein KUL152_30640 [Tenacibaculum sp. KUL152]|nr:hypothetical protein KUL152_30640 [Tenacibaculum sp. KUL152]GFD94491.1 hypothetical protein KUL154_32240 [Alteromonas sp. KUL154]GFE01319.1 hypothetical protein KUL156_39110 [Alteromonas sp. KUL156]